MIPIACFLLLAVSTSVELADEVFHIPPRNWRYMELGLNQRPALVNARFEVDEGPPTVRLAMLTRAELERLQAGKSPTLLSVTPPGLSGRLFYDLPHSGSYVLVVENRGPTDAVVHLRVLLDFAGRQSLTVTQISPTRRAVVVTLSLAVFFAIATFSARRLLKAIGR